MIKKFSFIAIFSVILLVVSSVIDTDTASAGYADNYSRLYYDLADQVYNVGKVSNATLTERINAKHGEGKFKVISSVDVDNNPNHPMGQPFGGLDKSGFKAMAVVAVNSGKVFISFAGSQDTSDYKTALVTLEETKPGQAWHAHLYLNYIYSMFENYRNFDWYLTGHSLGGWVAAKTFLDVRSARVIVPSGSGYTYGGPIKKATISGVYTFNALPVAEYQMDSTQWNANKNRTYHSYVKNLYVENEWLNSVYDMHTDELAYIGTTGGVNAVVNGAEIKLPYYTSKMYHPGTPSFDLVDYYRINLFNNITEFHGRKYLEYFTYY